MQCDQCPNEFTDARTHNQVFYELHVFINHPVDEAIGIINDYYTALPEEAAVHRFHVNFGLRRRTPPTD